MGFVAVVAGLVFVGVEIQQNNKLARAATRQALAETSLQTILAVATDPELSSQFDIWIWGEEGQSESCPDGLHQACRWVRAQVRLLENAFLQFHDGVIDESVFFSYGWRDSPIFLSPSFEPWWDAIKSSHYPDFVAAFETAKGVLQPG